MQPPTAPIPSGPGCAACSARSSSSHATRAAKPTAWPSRGALAFTTYKTDAGLDARFPFEADLSSGKPVHPVDRYLWKRGRAFAGRFDARTYLTLCASIDLCDLRPEELTVPSWLIAWEEDRSVPLWLVEEMHRRTGARSRLRILHSDGGHDAFLLHAPEYQTALRESLELSVAQEA